ncbi:MAG: cytochrome C [Betaproteobacteria bacterium]|nr:cytochrome C [Betaproteobacteria bacterium]
MFSSPDRLCGWALMRRLPVFLAFALTAGAASAQVLPGLGRPATPKEIAAWDIDVRPDFKGLPKGAGTVAHGQDIWEAKCASCHGVFGESNEVFSPLIGGTTPKDIETGRVARLADGSFPGRTTLMRVPTVATLWDYINRAMPWNAPKSLKVDEVYAVTAFMLNLGGIVPDNFTLSDQNIRDVQNRMPNRKGMTTDHAMWPGKGLTSGRLDVKAVACMSNCATEASVASMLPDHARNAHGNLAEQNRIVGAQRGADTTRPAALGPEARLPAPPHRATAQAAAAPAAGPDINGMLAKNTCTACHAMDRKLVGPSFREVAEKYAGKPDSVAYLAQRIKHGGSGVWGQIPMPAQGISAQDTQMLVQWIAEGAKRP